MTGRPRYIVSGSAGQLGGRRFAILDTHDRQGGKGMRRVEYHATLAAAQRKAQRLNREEGQR